MEEPGIGFWDCTKAFIICLAMQQQLAKVDRLKKWGVQVAQGCVLCNPGDVETLSHLFFECRYSYCMRQTLLEWLGVQRQIMG